VYTPSNHGFAAYRVDDSVRRWKRKKER
jgi:hypothetical protein